MKRFAKNAYTVNYVAFVKAIDEVQEYLDEHGMMDLSGELLDQFPGRVITAELPKLPRPEVGKIMPHRVFGRQTIFHPVMEPTRESMPLPEVIERIQRHILESRIQIHGFFKVALISHCKRSWDVTKAMRTISISRSSCDTSKRYIR